MAGLEHADLDLVELVGATVDEAAARHPRLAWTSNLPPQPLPLRGWEPGLRLLVDNLLENAANHGPGAGGAVRVTLMPPREDAGPALHVDDDGPGVPEEERKRVFEPFARVNGTTASGSGLGLALVAQQSRAHCATVEIERSPLGGARFTVRFRAAASTAAEGRLQG
ncbi:MAG: sensor histidine kinase [Thermoleophilaceae bacterium]